MRKDRKNIYREARLVAGMTIEQAAERIGVAPRTLASYELGEYVPPADVVALMCEVYHTPWLAYQHLKQHNALGARYLPDIDFSCLATSVLRLQKELADVQGITADMIAVACDGRVDVHEVEVWNRVRQEVYELIAAGVALMLASKVRQKEKAPALAVAQ